MKKITTAKAKQMKQAGMWNQVPGQSSGEHQKELEDDPRIPARNWDDQSEVFEELDYPASKLAEFLNLSPQGLVEYSKEGIFDEMVLDPSEVPESVENINAYMGRLHVLVDEYKEAYDSTENKGYDPLELYRWDNQGRPKL